MAALVCDPIEVQALIKRRRETGADRYDEVWEGLYVMSPSADPEHQWIVGRLTSILSAVIEGLSAERLRSGESARLIPVDPQDDGWLPSEVVGLSFRATAESRLEVKTLHSPHQQWRI